MLPSTGDRSARSRSCQRRRLIEAGRRFLAADECDGVRGADPRRRADSRRRPASPAGRGSEPASASGHLPREGRGRKTRPVSARMRSAGGVSNSTIDRMASGVRSRRATPVPPVRRIRSAGRRRRWRRRRLRRAPDRPAGPDAPRSREPHRTPGAPPRRPGRPDRPFPRRPRRRTRSRWRRGSVLGRSRCR